MPCNHNIKQSADTDNRTISQAGGFVLIELVVITLILLLLISLVSVSVIETIRRVRLDEDIAQFARTLRLASDQAVFSKKNFIVKIDVMDGYYTVYEEESKMSTQTPRLIDTQQLKWSYIKNAQLEDGTHQYSGDITLVATPQGWNHSILFNLIDDRNERKRYIRCDRFTSRTTVLRQPLEMWQPRKSITWYPTQPNRKDWLCSNIL